MCRTANRVQLWKLNEVVSLRDVIISILKYGKYIDTFAEKAIHIFSAKNINVLKKYIIYNS